MDKIPTGEFVALANLETASTNFVKESAELQSSFDRIFTRKQFQARFESSLADGRTLSNADFDVLLVFLSRDKQLVDYDGNVIRIKTASDMSAGITKEDAAVASLKELVADMRVQTNVLSVRVEELARNAKAHVVKNNVVSAKAALRSKKLAESSLVARYSTLNQLEEIASKIQQAHDQIQLVKVMETSTVALQGLNAQVGGVDKVDNVMDKLREQMNEVDEVGDVIAQAGREAVVIDEGELDDELEALEQAEAEKAEEKQKQRKAEEEAKEAEDLARRLAETSKVPQDVPVAEGGERMPTPTTETAEVMGELSLA